MTSVAPEGQWASNIPAHRSAAFFVRTCELIIYFFLGGGVGRAFLPGFWAALFSGANSQNVSLPL